MNLEVSVPLPLRAVLKPGETRTLLALGPKDPKRSWSYRMAMQEAFGDPGAAVDHAALYLLPFEHGSKRPLGQGYFGKDTHQRVRALDFDMPVGTRVCAAREGVVVALKEDSAKGGPSPAYVHDANYVDILHADGSWASYAHFRQGGVAVALGQKVQAGQLIGYSGATGQAAGPHLHFSVQKASWGAQPETLATRFRLDERDAAFLTEGKFYYAWHPGGPPFQRVSADLLDERALRAQDKPAKPGKLSFREESLDDRVLIWAVNGTAKKLKLTVHFRGRGGAMPSRPGALVEILPPRTERFLFSVLMKPGSSYQLDSMAVEQP